MLWSALACLNQFINSVVWAGNYRNSAPAWCEISIRIMMGSGVGIPAASLCINRRLYKIASVQAVSSTRAEKRRDILVDTAICVGFPIIYLVLVSAVQGHRFDILEDIGCFPAIYNTIPTYFISTMWPLVIGLVSAGYCIATLYSFNQRRLAFSSFLRSNQTSLTFGRYFRLMALAMTDVLLSSPLAIFSIWVNATATPIFPYISWADTHYGFSRVDTYPALFWRSNHISASGIQFSRWIGPACAIIFFAFFGVADEARKNYVKAFMWLSKPFRSTSPPSPPTEKFSSKEKLVSISRYISPRPAFSVESSSSTLPMYSSSSPSTVVSLPSSMKRNDSVSTLKSPPSAHSPRKSKSDSLFSSSADLCSPTLTCYSLPEYDSEKCGTGRAF